MFQKVVPYICSESEKFPFLTSLICGKHLWHFRLAKVAVQNFKMIYFYGMMSSIQCIVYSDNPIYSKPLSWFSFSRRHIISDIFQVESWTSYFRFIMSVTPLIMLYHVIYGIHLKNTHTATHRPLSGLQKNFLNIIKS